MKSLSILPGDPSETVFLVVDNLGALGRVYVEANVKDADLETVIEDIAAGQYSKPFQIVAFNTSECWCRDVTLDVAIELLHRAQRGHLRLSEVGRNFVEFQTGRIDRTCCRILH